MAQTKEQKEALDKVFQEMLGSPPTEEEASRIRRLLKKLGKKKGKGAGPSK